MSMNIISVKEYNNSKVFEIPSAPFIYSPVRQSSFNYQGEEMVKSLLSVAPNFASRFDKVISAEEQKEVANASFIKCKLEWETFKKDNALAFQLEDLTETESGEPSKKYFECNRVYGRLVPVMYKRTAAPRISTKGNTFHGMKKNLLETILIELSTRHKKILFIDVDMTAAHVRIARKLTNLDESNLDRSLKDAQFWNTQIAKARPFYEELGVNISDKTIKRMLKVALYTSMNGGNPAGNDQILKNLAGNAAEIIQREKMRSVGELRSSPLYVATMKSFDNFDLIKEVSNIKNKCAILNSSVSSYTPYEDRSYLTFTVDRAEPYVVLQPHKGISRVLQGFEVVLLSVLVKDLLSLGMIPISLDHDGVLVMLSEDQFREHGSDPASLCKKISGKSNNLSFHDWSEYLLDESLPIEAKRLVKGGELKVF